jgi:hypothetical protein
MQSVCAWIYCHLWLVWLNNVLPHFLVNGTILETNVTAQNIRISISSTPFVWNISHSKKNSARYYHACTQVFKKSTRYSCQILMKPVFTWISSTNFKKILISNLMKICPVKAEVLREDGRTDTTKLTVAFRNFARAPNNPVLPVTSRDVRKY